MNKYENYFKKHKIIISFFILSFIIFLISAIYSHRGAFFDIPGEFLHNLNYFIDNKLTWSFKVYHLMCRYFSIEIDKMLFCTFFPFAKSLPDMLNLFTLSFILTPFLCLFLNYIVALRTKRFDIAVLTVVFYSFFIIPYISWFTRESALSSILQFSFLSYFLSREKFNKYDIFFIGLLVLYLFESFENAALLGLIFFIAGLCYYKKDPVKNKSKMIMGLFSFLVSVYIFCKTIYIMINTNFTMAVSGSQWIFSIKRSLTCSFETCMIISIIGILLCCFLLLLKRDFNKKDLYWGIPLLFITLLILYKITAFIPNPGLEMHLYAYSLTILPLIVTITILLDYFNIEIRNESFYSNVLVIACIVGILQFIWQINSSIYCFQYVNSIKNSLSINQNAISILHFDEEDPGYAYENGWGSMHRSLIFAPQYKIKTIIFPDPQFRDYKNDESCYGKTFYYEKGNKIVLQSIAFDVKNSYWDLTDVVEEFKHRNLVVPK